MDSPNRERGGGWMNRNIVGMGLTSLFSDMSHEMVTAVLPFFITLVLGGSPAVVGLVEGGSDGVSSAVKVLSGHISDRIRRTPLIRFGYSLTAFLKPMISFVSTWQQLMVLRLTAWAGRGARGPPRDALLSESVSPVNAGKAFGFHRSMDTLGAIAGPAIAFALMPYLSYRGVILFSILPGIVSVVVVFVAVKDVRGKMGKVEGFASSVRKYSREFYYFVAVVGLFGLSNFSNVMFTLRAEEILEPVVGAHEAARTAVLLYTLLNVIYAAASYPVGNLADRYSKKKLLASGYIVFAFAAALSSFPAPSILPLIFVLAGLHIAIVNTTEAAYCNQLLGDGAKGFGFGILQTVNGAGDFFSSFLIGLLWSFYSPFATFIFASSVSFAAAMLLLTTLRK